MKIPCYYCLRVTEGARYKITANNGDEWERKVCNRCFDALKTAGEPVLQIAEVRPDDAPNDLPSRSYQAWK